MQRMFKDMTITTLVLLFFLCITIYAVNGQPEEEEPKPVTAKAPALPVDNFARPTAAPAVAEAVAATFLPPLQRQPALMVREFLGRSRGGPPLYKLPACRESVRTHCSRAVRKNNFAVLECLQRSQAVAQSLPAACQAAIWQLKYNLTHNIEFETVASGACQGDLRRIKTCAREPPRSGLRLTCLIEHLANVTDRNCRSYLRRLEPLVFADFRLVDRFISTCKADVSRTECGRLEPATSGVSASMPTSQGRTVACLGTKIAVVSHPCRLQLLRLAELQTSDYHNDRPLYYACRDERERLCGAVSSGAGRVLACLNRQRESAAAACQVELARVRSLAAFDFAIYRRFSDTCGPDLRSLGCLAPQGEPSGSAAALMCLESGLITKGAKSVTGDCQAAMVDVRSDFLSDPRLLPELAASCAAQLQSCRADRTSETGLLHCIMRQLRAARDAIPDTATSDNATHPCERAVDRVLRVAMPMKDLRADPVVMGACSGEIRTHCSAPGVVSVYACLKSILAVRRDSINTECADRIAELVYFENRDFRLNVDLYRACQAEARDSCGVRDGWWRDSGGNGNSLVANGNGQYRASAVVFNCLFRLMNQNNNKIDKGCAAQLTKSLHDRATRSRLDPRLFTPCLRDLSRLCLKSRGSGEEFACLQDNINLLDKTCGAIVRQLSVRIDENLDVSPDVIFVQSCQDFVRKYCNRAEGQLGLDKTVMSCLIARKGHSQMDRRCRAGVEHHQLVSMRDYHISRDFAAACESDIGRLCTSAKADGAAAAAGGSVLSADKVTVVRCLATAARDDVLKGRQQRLSPACQRQVSLELLQLRRLPGLDPSLAVSCDTELRSLCPPGGSEDRVACLRKAASADSNGGRVGRECRAALFQQDKVLLNVPVLDAKLMQACQRMISRYCSDRVSRPVELYTCLRARMHHASFDANCFSVVNERMLMQQADYRLNPELQRYCGVDINRHCEKQKLEADKRDAAAPDPSNQGAVTRCLRDLIATEDDAAAAGRPPAAAPPGKALVVRKQCRSYLRSLALEFNLNYRLDPRLAAACSQVAESYCHAELEDVRDSGSSLFRVTECLKRLLAQGRIRSAECSSEVRRLAHESAADIHVDPLLYKACSSEVTRLCPSVSLGGGRQMRCIVTAFNVASTRLLIGRECSLALEQRLRLIKAAGIAQPESLSGLALQVNESPVRAYFVALTLSMLLLAFVLGFCGGRGCRRGFCGLLHRKVKTMR